MDEYLVVDSIKQFFFKSKNMAPTMPTLFIFVSLSDLIFVNKCVYVINSTLITFMLIYMERSP